MTTRRLGDMTSIAFAALDPKPPLLVPVGIVEEHGPHLPLDTDTIQAVETCERAAQRVGALVAAPVAWGNCSSTRGFPGSFSLRFDTVRMIAEDVLSEAHRQGFGAIAFVSGHAGGGHMRALRLAAEAHVERHPQSRVFVLSDWDLLRGFDAKAAAGVDVPSWDGHAGCLETSRMMDLRPELVRGTAAAHRVAFPDHLVEAHPEKRFPSGVMGDPTLASAALGRAANAWIVERMVEVLSGKSDS